MAETLGSLVDKLTIKDLREYHLRQLLAKKDKKFTAKELKSKLSVLALQKKALIKEIESFIVAAIQGTVMVRDEKLKLYNPRASMGKIPKLDNVGEAIFQLARKNSELWHLEDEARRQDASLSFIGSVKKKIDLANQQRNDYIDTIDKLFERMVRTKRR